MCGIAGILQLDNLPVRREPIERMVETLDHRGPDAYGIELRGPVGLGHTRLSIIDLAGGVQPMSSADGNLTVTFNGEIFNYLKLRQELIDLGRRFSSNSDTEVLLQAYTNGARTALHISMGNGPSRSGTLASRSCSCLAIDWANGRCSTRSLARRCCSRQR